MKVTLAHGAPPGTRRFEYDVLWHQWALPLSVALLTSFFPTETATLELDDRWEKQRVLSVRVLCVTMRVVLTGPLFVDDD